MVCWRVLFKHVLDSSKYSCGCITHVPNSAYLVLPKHSVWSLRFPPGQVQFPRRLRGSQMQLLPDFRCFLVWIPVWFGFTGCIWKPRSEQGVNHSRGWPTRDPQHITSSAPYRSWPPAPLFIHHFQSFSARPSPPVCSALFLDRKWEGSRTGRPVYSQSLSTRSLFSKDSFFSLWISTCFLSVNSKLKPQTTST